jgi:hypothetical protein
MSIYKKRWFPWTPLQNWIDKKFANDFDSSHKIGLTAQEIVTRDELALKNHPFLFKLDKFIDKFELNLEYYFIDPIFQKPRIFYSNWKNSTHAIQTGKPIGQWQDSMDKLFHGTFNQIIYFVNHEAKRDFDYYKEYLERENKDQDYYPEHQTDCYDTCLKAKEWYEVTYKQYLNDIENLYDKLPHVPKEENPSGSYFIDLADKDPNREKQRRTIYEEIRDIEDKITKEKIFHMQEIARINPSLWS